VVAQAHFSWSNSRWIVEEGRRIEKLHPMSIRPGLEADMREFAEHLLDHVKYPRSLKDEKIGRLFRKPLPQWKKCLFMTCKHEFGMIAKR
jgi:hypothetical protein